MYQRLPSWVLGFHGTDDETVQKLLNDPKAHLLGPKNDYDWIGNGAYFWENDPHRALEFSKQRMRWKGIKDKKPAVIGAVIDLGLCLNLFDQPALQEVQAAYETLEVDYQHMGTPLPQNVNVGRSKDKVMRHLDCTVIELLHRLREEADLPPYQTVRSPFPEGKVAYPGAGFRAKNHVQIAVRDPDSVLGFFLPRSKAGR